MDSFTLYRDLADLLTIVGDDGRGWPGAYWSSGVFVADAWAISRRRKTELNRPTREWARRLEWPEPVARWSRTSGELIILDEAPGWRAERYLGIAYDPTRWQSLTPDAFAVAVCAAAYCSLTTATAAQAVSEADRHHLARFSASDWCLLRTHADAHIRDAVGVRPQLRARVTMK
jgi:hypothetical protein